MLNFNLRGAGEMKGVSLEENKKNIEALKLILSREENKVCADCVGSSVRPTWASINCGTFICMRCAGFHRGLGVHVSKVLIITYLIINIRLLKCTVGTVMYFGYMVARTS